MKLNVHEEAANWYIEEMGLEKGDHVRVFTKLYGGIPTVFPSYFLGVKIGEAGEAAVEDVVNGITFYIKNEDTWLLNDHDLEVKMGDEEAAFEFIER